MVDAKLPQLIILHEFHWVQNTTRSWQAKLFAEQHMNRTIQPCCCELLSIQLIAHEKMEK